MQFSHKFADDLEQLDFFAAEPWALVRFADGEREVLQSKVKRALRNKQPTTADGWDPNASEGFRYALSDSFSFCDLPHLDNRRYFVGISCPCCDRSTNELFLRSLLHADPGHLTFSNLFVNANYDRFRERCQKEHFGSRCVIVGSGDNCNYDIPSNLVNHPQAMDLIDGLVARLCEETKTILVAAGPAANVIIHRYWTTCPPEKRRVICDIGSALDPYIHGRFTRGYHDPDHPNRDKVCVWTMEELEAQRAAEEAAAP